MPKNVGFSQNNNQPFGAIGDKKMLTINYKDVNNYFYGDFEFRGGCQVVGFTTEKLRNELCEDIYNKYEDTVKYTEFQDRVKIYNSKNVYDDSIDEIEPVNVETMTSTIQELLNKQYEDIKNYDIETINTIVFQDDDIVQTYLIHNNINEDDVDLESLRDLQHVMVNKLS